MRPTLEYCSHIWGGASQSSLFLLDRIQVKAIRFIDDVSLTSRLQSLHHRRLVSGLALFYRYYFGRCSDELISSVPLPKSYSRTTRLEQHANPYMVSLPRCRTTSHSSSFFPRISRVWNHLPLSVFPSTFDLGVFKTSINRLDLSSL